MSDEVRALRRERDQYRYAYEYVKAELEQLEARHRVLLVAFNALAADIHPDTERLAEVGT